MELYRFIRVIAPELKIKKGIRCCTLSALLFLLASERKEDEDSLEVFGLTYPYYASPSAILAYVDKFVANAESRPLKLEVMQLPTLRSIRSLLRI